MKNANIKYQNDKAKCKIWKAFLFLNFNLSASAKPSASLDV